MAAKELEAGTDAGAGPAEDEDLRRVLRAHGIDLDLGEVRRIVAGAAAAAPGPIASPGPGVATWVDLICPDPPAEVLRVLQTLHARAVAAQADDGLGPGPAPGPRLSALRAELLRRGLDGFIVPRADEHQGEYVPRRAERLNWLTGFTGSAGVAVVLRTRAALFVDGRYTLQAARETDPVVFEPHHLVDDPADVWIAAHLEAAPPPEDPGAEGSARDGDGRGGRLGYDPWLHTPDAVRRLEAACQRAGGRLVPCATNPVDAVWTTQPPRPLAPVVAHFLPYTGRSGTEKRRLVAEELTRTRLGAVVLTAPDSIAWLFNIRGGDVPYAPLPLAFAIIYADANADLFLDPRKLAPGVRHHMGASVRIHPVEAFAAALKALGPGTAGADGSNGVTGSTSGTMRVGVDRTTAPMWVVDRLTEAGAKVERGADPCALPRACKNEVERAGARAAHRRDGAAVTRFLAWLAEAVEDDNGNGDDGVTELSATAHLEGLRAEMPLYRGPSFPTIAGAGPNGAIVHYRATRATNRPLVPGSLFLLDSGGQYLDGTTDITRTVAIGRPTNEHRRRFTQVLKGHIALATAVFPVGTTGSQLDVLARRTLWEDGIDYDHGTGHGVGSYLGVHEGPQRISKAGSTVALQPGMILSDEPGYYKADAFGIRIENLLAVTPVAAPPGAERELLGFDVLTLVPIDRALIDAALLDGGERAWVDAYHRRVATELSALLDPLTADWLAHATAPLA